MIPSLSFDRAAALSQGRRIRRACFVPRSSLPVSAACVVANGVRESLSALLGGCVSVRLLEPVVPDPPAWTLILADASVYRVRGPHSDAALIFRNQDALGIAACVFGERSQGPRPLSPIEDAVMTRAVRTLAAALSPVCGPTEKLTVDPTADRAGFVTYFELLVGGPLEVKIGIGLARDPNPPPGPCLRFDDLLDVEFELRAEFAHGEIEAAELLLLQPNTTLRMKTKVGAPAVLKLAGRIVARGACGALGDHSAFAVADNPKGGSL